MAQNNGSHVSTVNERSAEMLIVENETSTNLKQPDDEGERSRNSYTIRDRCNKGFQQPKENIQQHRYQKESDGFAKEQLSDLVQNNCLHKGETKLSTKEEAESAGRVLEQTPEVEHSQKVRY